MRIASVKGYFKIISTDEPMFFLLVLKWNLYE